MHRNQYYADPLSLSFLQPQKNDVLDHHYFAKKHHETSQSKFKPTLHFLFTFGWTQWGSSYLCVVDNHTCTIMSSCPFVSPPTHLRRECSPTIFGSITTLYLISRILGNPSWYTTVESGGLLGDVMISPSRMAHAPFILDGITAYKAQLAIFNSYNMLKCIPTIWPRVWSHFFASINTRLTLYESLKDSPALLELVIWELKSIDQSSPSNTLLTTKIKIDAVPFWFYHHGQHYCSSCECLS